MCLCDKITDVSEFVTCSISHNEMFFHTIFWLLGKTSKALSCVFRIEASAEWLNVKYSFFKSVAFTFTFACSLSLPSAASLFIFSRHPARLVNQASFLSPWPCLLTGQIHSAWPLSPFNKPSEGWSRRTSESTRQTRKWKRKGEGRGRTRRGRVKTELWSRRRITWAEICLQTEQERSHWHRYVEADLVDWAIGNT